jgi:hypothetical protein
LKCTDVVANSCILCNSQNALFNGACVATCPENFFNQNGVCKPCLSNCKKCRDSNTCDECILSFNLKDGNQCVKDCGDGYALFPMNTCRKCSSSCLQCSNNDVNQCSKCYANYFLYNNECRSTCPEGTFATEKMTCEPCPMSSCSKCDGGKTCSSCIANYVLENNKCKLPPCSDGWVLKQNSNECVQCLVDNCKSCPNTNLGKCDNCVPNYYLIGDNKCDKNCILGTYLNVKNNRCENCFANCLTCKDNLSCSQCDTNYYLLNNTCVKDCPSGYSKVSGKCEPCQVKDCDICPNNSDCQKCKVPLVLQNGVCQNDCAKGYFSNGGVCKQCTLFCDECDNELNCKVCQKGKILSVDNKCLDDCPSGSVNVNGKCVLCKSDLNCDKCSPTDQTQCISCKGSQVLKSNTCVDNCGDSFYVSSKVCSPCKQGCKVCTDANSCLECVKGNALYQNNCVVTCPPGTRKENDKCVPCLSDCLTCDSSQCLVCITGMLLENGKCVKKCSNGFYTINNINCLPCDVGCVSCLTEKTCNICRENLFLKEGKCVDNCGDGYVGVSGKCEKCGVNCKECNPKNPSECLVCLPNKFLLNGECLDDVPNRYYSSNNKVYPCLSGCDVCTSIDTCEKCTPPLFLTINKKSCVNTCPDGFKGLDGKCVPCEDKNCQNCASQPNICEVCNTPYLIYNGICVSTCPNGYYRDEAGKKCLKCVESCSKCAEQGKCTECAKGFVLQNYSCQNVCKPGSINVNSVCQDCQTPNCEICQNNISTCAKCLSGKTLLTITDRTLTLVANLTAKVSVNGTVIPSNISVGINSTLCIDACPNGFYENNGVCTSCGDNCDKCSNSLKCTLCTAGFVLQDGKCQKTCDKYFVENNGECVRCVDLKCVNCDPLTRKECRVCDENYVLKNNECKTECGSGYFKFEISKGNNVCKPCSFKCDVCSNENSCDKCSDGSFLKNKECVTDCGKGSVFKDNNKCIDCTSQSCISCDPNNPDKCLTCSSDSYLKGDQCVKTCGDKFYASPKGVCIPCVDSNCLTCDPNDKCKVCNNGMKVLNGECRNSCPNGMVADRNNTCINCNDKNCQTCDVNDIKRCSKCASGFLLQPDFTCNSNCPAKYFNSLNERCLPCAKNCDVCKNDKECGVCSAGNVLDKNLICTDKCPLASVEVQGKCVDCKDKSCSKCQSSDPSICDVCLPGFYLYRGGCVAACPQRTFALGSNCVNCGDSNCLNCTSESECKVCDQTYLLFNKGCVKNCTEGYYESKGECTQCPNFEKTRSCNSTNPVIPTLCRDKYFLDSVCVEACPSGKFPDSNKVCQNCGSNCTQCGSLNSCKTCSNTTVLYNGNCTNSCPLGTVNIQKECINCDNKNCNECQPGDLSKCTSCKDKLLLLNDDCFSVCPSGYFAQGKNCLNCDSKCAECKSDKICDRCLNQFVNLNGTCLSQCPSGSTVRNGVCYSCASNKCSSCDSNDLNKCLQCSSGYLLNELCNDVCPVGYRANEVQKTCVPCTKYCDKCDENGCLVCTKGFYFSEADKRFCVECTESNLVVVNNICETCKVQGCKRCEDANSSKCKLCDSSKVLVNGNCLDVCPQGTFKVDQTCQACDSTCKTCSNAQTCDTCDSSKILFNGKCLSDCPAPFIKNSKGACVVCDQADCDKCDPSNTSVCNTCKLPTLLYKGQCYKQCPNGTYPDSSECKQCPPGCNACNKNNCIGCTNGLKLKGSECVKECGPGYFDNIITCEKCLDGNCDTCSPASVCKKCQANMYLVESTNTCVVVCPDGSYTNKEKGVCSKCDVGCSSCDGTAKCKSCDKGLFLYNGVCNQSCPQGFSALTGACKQCSSGCVDCPNNTDVCESCSNSNLYNKKCISECPRGTYTLNNKCIDCDRRCEECKSGNECLKCKSEFNLYKGECVNKCSDGKVDINGKCISCIDENCKSCLTDASICVECKNPYMIFNNVCKAACPDGTFPGSDNSCKACTDGCSQCNSSSCSKCDSGYFLYNNRCFKECPKGMWGNCDENMCYMCNSACEDCADATANNCSKCREGYFKNGKVCVKETGCPRGNYPNKESRECTACKIPLCAACSDRTICTECVKGYEMNANNECVISKSFISVIGENPVLFSSKTLRLYRSSEIRRFNQDLKGIGVNSNNVSFFFWLRRLNDNSLQTNIFETVNGFHNINLRFDIVPVDGKPTCRLSAYQDTNVYSADLGSCNYQDLFDWAFVTITLTQVKEQGYVSVKMLNNKAMNRSKNVEFKIPQSSTFINTESTLLFNNNMSKNNSTLSTSFEIANFNVFDYETNQEEINKYFAMTPNNCDYTCSDCKGKCIKCPGNVPPSNDGLCQASFVSFLNDYQNIITNVSVDLRRIVPKRLDSNRYALFLWFNPANLTKNQTEIGTVYNDYSQSEILIRFFLNNSKLMIQVGQESYTAIDKFALNSDTWNFIGATISGQTLNVYLKDLYQVNESNLINLKYMPSRLTEDAVFINGPYAELNNTSIPFVGAFYDIRLYVNNLPTNDEINSQYLKLPCPANCQKCTSFLTCANCNQGYKLLDNICVENTLSRNIELLDKYSFFRGDSLTLSLPSTFSLNQYTVSFFYRRKTHSLDSPPHNVLSIEAADGKLYPLITQLNGQNDESSFIVLGQNTTGSVKPHNFNDEIYSYIHFIVGVDITNKVVSFNINDGTEFTSTKTLYMRINKFILGDSTRNEMNFEIGNFNIYEGLIDKQNYPKLRSTAPLDCNPGCVNCNYKTGTCNKCLSGKSSETNDCSNVLRGFSYAHLFNIQTLNQNMASQYSSSLNTVFKKDVNSMEYSVIGYYRILNKPTAKVAKYELLRLSNRGDQLVSPSSNLIGLEIFTNNTVSNYYITYTDANYVRKYLVKDLEVSTEWTLFLASINVKDKLINFAIQQLNSARIYTDTIKLVSYPEKLVENANLNLFGYGNVFSNSYQTLDIQFYRFYVAVNLKFSIDLLDKFKKNLPVPADPKCPANCDRCIFNSNQSIICLTCVKGFEIKNDQCIKSNSNLVYLADQNRNIFLPPKSDISMPSNAFLNTKNTITFYFRRNFSPKLLSADNSIFKGGNVDIRLIGSIQGDSSLIVSVRKYPTTLSFNIDSDLTQDYNWYLVIMNYSTTSLDVILKTENSSVKKGLVVDNSFKIEITSISYNSLNEQVSFFAPNMILNNFYEIDFVRPSTFCNLECDVCIENRCVECQWGFDENGECNRNPIKFNELRLGNNSTFPNQFVLRKYLDNPKPLRSRSWGITFTMELTDSFNTYLNNVGNSILSIISGNMITTSNLLFDLNFNSNYTFFLTVSNRNYLTELGTSYGFATNQFKTQPVNSYFVFLISFDGESNELSFQAYNSPDNFIKQTFKLKGSAENLNLDANVIFGHSYKASNLTIIYENIAFYFDGKLTQNVMNSFVIERIGNFQNSCVSNSRISCLRCDSNSFLVNKICSPVKTSMNAWLDQVKQVTNFIPGTVDQKYTFVNNSTQLTASFWFKLFTYTKDPFGVYSLTLQDGKIVYPIIKVHYSNNNLFVELYDSTKKQVNSIKFDNFLTPADPLSWNYISLSIDIPSNTINAYVYESRRKSNRLLSNSNPSTPVQLVLNSNKYAFVNFGYETTLQGVGYYFEVSSLVLSMGWFAVDTNQIELYRLRIPRKCSHKCMTQCDNFNLCPPNGYLVSDITVDNIYSKNLALKGKVDSASMKTLSLFRFVADWLPESNGNPVWGEFLLSFEIDVPSILSSTYTPNNHVILALSNSQNPNYYSMTMNDIIPSEILQYGILGIEAINEGIKFWIGSSLAGNTITYYNLNLQSLKGINKLKIQLFMDSRNQKSRITAYLDDLRTFYDIQTVYPLQSISLTSMVYSHPLLNNFKITVNNPRFLNRYDLTTKCETQDNKTITSNRCGTECLNCTFVPKAMIFSCDKCQAGYVLINNVCMKSNNQ